MNYSDIKKKYGLGSTTDAESKDDKKKNNLSYADITAKYGLKSNADKDFINSFISDANKFLSSAEEDYGKVGWSNASDFYEARNSTYADLSQRSSTIRRWLASNKSKLDEDTYQSIKDALDSIYKGTASVVGTFNRANEFYSQFDSEEAYNAWNEAETKKQEILNAEDFEEYSQIGANIENPSVNDALIEQHNLWDKLFKDEVNNPVTFGRNNAEDLKMQVGIMADSSGTVGEYNKYIQYELLEEDEANIYNYYLGKGDVEKANEYLASMQETINQRQAGKIVENIGDSKLLSVVFAAGAGLDQFASGIGNLDNFFKGTEADATTSTQYASAALRENLSGGWGVAYDLSNTLGNMALPMAIGAAYSPILGTLSMGASTMGNAYAEMKKLGYNDWQSRGYGILVGASEAGLQYVLGGITKLGGKVSSKAVGNFLSKFDNALARTAIQLGGNMISEGAEEAIQTILEPAFKALVTGEEFESAEWEDIWYSALLGALSAGVMEGIPTVAGEVNRNHTANKLYGTPSGTSNLVNQGLEFAEGTEARTLAEKYNTKLTDGKKLSGSQLAHLVEASESQFVTDDKAKLKKSILQKLGELGETHDVTPIAEVLVKYAMGEKLSSSDINTLNNSDYGHKVMTGLNKENIKSGSLNDNWAENIGTKRISPESYNKNLYELAKQVAEVRKTAEEQAVAKTIADSEAVKNIAHKTSESGKTIYKDANGDAVDVAVKRIVSTDGGIKVELDNGKTVKATDLEFGTAEEAMMYEMVARMEVTPETANELINTFKPANSKQSLQFLATVPLAYQYGKMGYEEGLKNIALSKEQKKLAYNRGRMDAVTQVESHPSSKIKSDSNKTTSTKENGIIFEDGFTYNEKTANELQRSSMVGIETIAKMSSLEVHVFASWVEGGKRYAYVNGKKVKAPNGYFKNGNQVFIDINAGPVGEGTMLYVMSHEIVHYIRKWNAKGFKELGDFLIEQFGKQGVAVHERLKKQEEKIINRYTEEKKALPSEAKLADMAYEELVADAMSEMFTDPMAYEKLAKLKQQNLSLWKKLGEAIKALLDKLKKALGVYRNGKLFVAKEASEVESFTADVYNKLQDLYLKAFVEADANYEAAEKTLQENGISVDSETESATIMSVRDVLDDEQRQEVSKALASRFGVTQEEALQWLTAETSLASLILNPKYSQYLDYVADPNEVAIKTNSDYPQGTVDFSPICAKRREFTSVMNNILRLFPNHVFEATDLAKIRSIMQEEGMTIPCGICYVEDRRQLDTIVAQNFIDSLKLYREGSKTRPDGKPFNANQLKGLNLINGDSYTPSVYELVSLEGLNLLKKKNPKMAEAWVKFNNARGMQSVRLLANEAEYKRQILKYSKKTVQTKNDHGGLRVYSFSDAEMFHLIDIIQVITDSATVGLSLQGYTKVNEYAKAVKDTGEKLNRSLIPKGELGYHIEDGKVILDYDTVEGIDINHPDFFDNKDNPNVGNITIGVSDVQIRAAMVSDFVDQIIPFHTGQSEEVLGEKGIATWSNYKDFQTEKDIATGKVSEHQINIYTEVLQVLEKEGKPITKRTFVEKFLQVCKENNLTPRFAQFLNTNENGEYVYTEGYHKMLVDFKTFAQTEVGEYLPQMPVKPIFDNAYITKILKDYVKSQSTKNAETAQNMPKVIERITNEIVKPGETKFSDRDSDIASSAVASDLVAHMKGVIKSKNNSWTIDDLFDYVKEHKEIDFVERIFSKDKTVRRDLEEFLNGIEDTKLLHDFSWFIGEAYALKDQRYDDSYRLHSPYVGAVRTFRNAVKKRTTEIASQITGGRDLKIKNGDVSLDSIKTLFHELNSNDDIGALAERVFATVEKLGVNIRFVNQVLSKNKKIGGDALGDMVEYKTSYFNDASYSDQRKAQTILHELIHTCTVYVLDANPYMGDVKYSGKSDGYNRIANAATRLNRIYNEIKDDPAFQGMYGIKNVKEMVAEFANPKFVETLKEKSLWQQILDFICELFGFTRGNSAYDNAKMCLDYIIDNPDISEYKAYATEKRTKARRNGYDVFGKTIDTDGQVLFSDRDSANTTADTEIQYSDRVLMGSLFSGGGTLEAGLVYQMLDKEFAVEYNKKIASAYTDNHGKEHMFVGDVQDFNSKDKQNVFYLHASPVCKNFSSASHSGGETTLDIVTAQATARVLEEQMPQVFTVENVKRYIGSEAYKIITDKLTELGYIWDVDVYKASDYGNATKRERMIIRAVKDGYLPAKPEKVSAVTSWGEATRDLWDTDLIPSNLVKSKIEAIRNTPKLKNLKLTKLDKPLMIYDTSKSKEAIYAWADELSPTLTTKCGDARIIMPDGRVYKPTPKFMGRIQGLPDDYKYPKAVTNAFKIIGNGIPTQLTKAVMGGVLDSAYEQTHDGEVLYSDRDTDVVSNRTILANALESAAQNDIEKSKLQLYKDKIALIESEQKKLNEIREKANKLRFTKGRTPGETKQMRDLDAEATQLANRINTYDKQLLNLESTKALKGVLEREKTLLRKRLKQQEKESINAVKERAAKTQRELMNRYTESRKKAIESRNKTAIRHKIREFKKQMQSNLEHPTDRVYIPASLAQAIIDICDLINTDTPLYKADGSLNKSQERRNQTKERLARLKLEYDSLKNNPDALIAEEYEEAISKYFDKLRTTYDGKSLMEMSLDELEEMYSILKSIDETLKEARKTIGWADAQDIYEAGDAIVKEQAEIVKSRKNGKRGIGQKAYDAAVDYTISPVRNVERMTGYNEDSFLTKLFREFERGVRTKNLFVMRAYKTFEGLTQGKNYDDAVYKEHGDTYTDVYGREFNVSKMQMMQTILSYEREVANQMTHIENGGFTFADLALLNKGKLREAISEENSHRVHPNVALKMVSDFTNALADDKWAQDYMEASRKFFNGMAKDAINETYLALKHRIIAKDEKYIPFETDKSFVVREISANNDIQQTINSYGMLQDIKKGASQPLIISGLNSMVDRHIEQVGSIQGLAIPVRNFNKIWNVRSVDVGFGNDPTVKGVIERTWGTGATKLITQTVQDLQGSRTNTQPWIYRKIKSGYIGAKFVMNGSVVLKQIGSLFTSTSMLKWRDPVSMMGNLVYTMAKYKKISAEVDKYSASVWMRRQGVSDNELHTLMTEANKPGFFKLLNKIPAVINPAKWISAMDSAVALSLWKYAKEDTAARTGLEGEELLKATAEFYDSVIENTQSMSDVLHRPEVQKRGDIISESLGMFKTDLFQNAGQLKTVYGRFMANKTKENGAALARTVYGITASTIWGTLIITPLIAMLRYKVDPYRDDEDDELTFESWIERLGFGFAGEVAGYIFPLLGGELVDIVESIAYGESTDEAVDSLVLTAVNDLISTMTSIGADLKEGEVPSSADWEKLLTKSLEVFGLPANTIARIINAIKLHVKDIRNGEFLSFEAGLTSPNSQRLYNAILSGDSERIEKAKRNFKDQKAIDSAIKSALRENDPRIRKAVKELNSNNIGGYASYVNAIAAEGNFDKELVSKAIVAEQSHYNTSIANAAEAKNKGKDEEYKKIVRELRNEYKGIYSQDDIVKAIQKAQKDTDREEDDDDKDKETSIYSSSHLNAAFESGDNKLALEIIDDLVRTKVANGKTEKEAKSSVRSSMTSYWKPLYKKAYESGNSSEMSRIRRILYQSDLYGSADDVVKTCQGWLKG